MGALLSLPPALAQEPPPSPQPEEPAPAEETFYEAIQVRTAEVEVIVTDRDGNRVTDLRREDFTLFEDGRPVELTGFAAYTAAPVTAASAAPGTEPSAPPSADAPAAIPKPSPVVMVLLDNQSLTLAGRKRLLEHVRQLIDELGPEPRIGISVQDAPGRLRVALAPTTDHAAVLAALERAADVVPGGNQTYFETQRLARDIMNVPDPAEDARS